MSRESWLESRFNSFKIEFYDDYIFKGKAWANKYVPSKTYLFAPECPELSTKGHVYVSGGGNHAEDNMAKHCGLPTKFYLTSAPCPDCAMKLYNAYNNKPKPTIHIALPYRGKGKTGVGNKKLNLECLAMLVDDGFSYHSFMELA